MASYGSGEIKAALREEVLGRRDGMGEEMRRSLSRAIIRNIISLPSYQEATTVLAYASFGSELQTWDFLARVLEDGKRLVLPRVNRSEGMLDLHEVEDPARDLEAGVWGILEPRVDLARISLSEIDFVLVPGAAFDPRGARLGYGGGFYDRLLAGCGHLPHLVGGCFELQVVEETPVESHDVLMGMVVTEGGITLKWRR